MKVSQVLCAAGPVDAVTNQGLACRRLFENWGWDGADYAEVLSPAMGRRLVRPLDELEPSSDEVLLVHYSGYAPGVVRLLDTPRRSLLLSHNITPARYFWAHEPVEGVRCALAPAQLAELARRACAVAGVSEYNAQELRDAGAQKVDVIPVLFDRGQLGRAGSPPASPPTILFVGRLAPHKRQDLVIRAFAAYRHYEPDARLVLVGVPISNSFEAQLRNLAEELAPGAVTFENGIPAARLWDYYRSAHAFLSLSEHEGFCIPLLEAFHFGVPVIARNAGAVGEVVGDAGILLDRNDDLATVAELLRIAVEDDELRAELRARGEHRLEAYEYDRTAMHLRDSLIALAAR
jgi:glycosyltransferase involved in cell wall biosynthesis